MSTINPAGTDTFTGTETASGRVSLTHDGGTQTVGQMTENVVSGTWILDDFSGTITGTKN